MWAFVFLLSCDILSFSASPKIKTAESEIAELSHISDDTQRELRALQLLAEYPQQSAALCSFITSHSGTQQCMQYANRPHLWTVSSADTWKGGFFFSRLLFPEMDIPILVPDSGACGSDARCLLDEARALAKTGNVKKAQQRCAALSVDEAKWECFFQASEVVQPVSYEQSVGFCVQAGSFAPECHNHLLLRLVQDGWLSPEKHRLYRSQIETYWQSSAYAKQLLDVYWSALSSRVVGVVQPFSMEDVPTSDEAFTPHLHSALALRVIFAPDPVQLLKESLMNTMQLSKAHGPNSPVFQPKNVWSADTEHEWIHFCDLRGGIRPMSVVPEEDQKLAIMTAAMMTIPPQKHLVEMFESDSSALVRWASQQLLLP